MTFVTRLLSFEPLIEGCFSFTRDGNKAIVFGRMTRPQANFALLETSPKTAYFPLPPTPLPSKNAYSPIPNLNLSFKSFRPPFDLFIYFLIRKFHSEKKTRNLAMVGFFFPSSPIQMKNTRRKKQKTVIYIPFFAFSLE